MGNSKIIRNDYDLVWLSFFEVHVKKARTVSDGVFASYR